MRKTSATLVLFSLFLSAMVFLSSCQMVNLGGSKEPATESKTLADIVIDDYIGQVQGTTFTRSLDGGGRLKPADLTNLKATIRNKIEADGLTNSGSINLILPSVMKGIALGVKNLSNEDGDTGVSAQLLSTAMKSTAESLGKNLTKLSSKDIVLSDVLETVVKQGTGELVKLAATDPDNAGKALQEVVSSVATALKSRASSFSEDSVLKAVVTASVQAAVENKDTNLVKAVFAGAAVTVGATTTTLSIGKVLEEAVLKSHSGQGSALLDAGTATELLKQASAGLGNLMTPEVADATAAKLKTEAAVTISSATITEVITVAAETIPTATLTATIDNVAYNNTELEFSTTPRSIVFTTPTNGSTTEELIGPDGIVKDKTYALSGSGTFRFYLKVKNASGFKSAMTTLLVRVKAKPGEVAPKAEMTIQEGTTPVTANLAWVGVGHTLSFDLGNTTTDKTTIKIQSNDPAVEPAKDAGGKWTVKQTSGTVQYTLLVKNSDGLLYTKVTKSVTINAEPAPVASLKAYDGASLISAALPKNAYYDVTLKAEGSTVANTTLKLESSPSVAITAGDTGVWTARITENTVFTLTVANVGGVKTAQAVKTITVASEVAPVAKLTIKNSAGEPVTTLTYQDQGHDLILDPTGSTTPGTEMTLSANTGNPTIVKNNKDGTWTASGILGTTTFTLTVKNTGGTLSSTKAATVTITAPLDTNVSADVAKGHDFVLAHDWSKAKTAFGAALNKNQNDKDAKIWSALLDLMTLGVHPQVVTLMTERIGVAAYPTSMEALLTKQWLTASVQDTATGFVKVTKYAPKGDYYVRGTLAPSTSYNSIYYYPAKMLSNDIGAEELHTGGKDFQPSATGDVMVRYWSQSNGTNGTNYFSANTYATDGRVAEGLIYETSSNILLKKVLSPLPELSGVAGFERLDWADAETHASASAYGPADYSRLLLANIMSRNPLGFNSAVDLVVNGPFGASLDSVISRLTSLGDGERTTIPAALIAQAADSVGMPAKDLPTVSLGKPELLILAAQLKSWKSMLQYVSSVNFDYPVGQVLVDGFAKAKNFNSNNSSETYLKTLYAATPGIYFSSLLKDRNLGQREASRASFLAALDDVSQAMALYKALVADETSGYRTTLGPMILTMAGANSSMVPSAAYVGEVLTNLQTQIAVLKTAVVNNGDYVFNQSLTSAGLNTFEALLGNLPSDKTITIKPAALWNNNVLNPRFWFEGTESAGLTLYVVDAYSYGELQENSFIRALPSDKTTMNAVYYNLASTESTGTKYRQLGAGLAFKLNTGSLQTFYPAAKPSEKELMVKFGPSWTLVDTNGGTWNSASNSYMNNYKYTLQPPSYVIDYVNWVNKK